ncbi:AAA family ATPase [Streptomyces sp. NPDC088729]|uniref:helix-turn-helix transcriptional regulator n=1 Tax=Streptomyces sp. NPDC088729 TaxID=3365876 RepID=UPI0037FC8356
MDDDPSRPFVGRFRELERLRSAAATATAGTSTVVLVSGPMGIGKSALVDTFVASVHEHFSVLSLEGSAHEKNSPFAAADRLLAPVRPGGLGAAGTGGGRTRAGAAHEGGDTADPSVLDVGAELLGALDSARPVLLRLDDAQDVDFNTLQACGFALLRLRGDRVLVVIGTDRPARTVADMGIKTMERRLERIELGGLTVPEARSYVRERLGRTPSEPWVMTLVEWSHGNPLYLEAVLGALPGVPADRLAIRMPSSLAEVVAEWARTSDPAGRRILDLLAVLDTPAPVPLLSRLLESDTVLADAQPLADRHMVVWSQESGVPLLGLLHTGQRQALYSALSQPERSRLHRRVADMVEPPERWWHQVAAAERFDPGLAATLRTAARQEAEAGQLALAARCSLASSQVDPSSSGRQEALLSAVRLLVVTGQYQSALHHRERVLHTPTGARRSEVLGLLDFAAGQDTSAHRQLREAWTAYEALGDRGSAAVAAAESGMTACSLGRGEEAMASSVFALRHSPDDVVRGMAHANAAYGQALVSSPARGLLRLGHLPDDPADVPSAETDSLTYRGMFRMLSGDLSGALGDLSVAARRRNWGMSRISMTGPLLYSVWCHFFLGDWRAAGRTLSVARDVARTAGRPMDFFAVHGLSSVLHAFAGQPQDASADLLEAAELELSLDFPGPGFHLSATRAIVEFGARNYERAASHLDRAYRDPAHAGRARLYALPHLPILGVARARSGEVERAAQVLRRLEAADGRGALHPIACDWVRGAVARARGDFDGAALAYRNALAVPHGCGDPVLIRTLVRCDLGELLLERGETDSGAAALREAESSFRVMGADVLAEQARSRAGDGPGTTTTARDVWGDLSDREKDVADLVARGWTNREIAAELCLSAKTVEYHLGNIYTKHGLRDRRELRDLVQERLA